MVAATSLPRKIGTPTVLKCPSVTMFATTASASVPTANCTPFGTTLVKPSPGTIGTALSESRGPYAGQVSRLIQQSPIKSRLIRCIQRQRRVEVSGEEMVSPVSRRRREED
jgi:hypothetical protein